MIANIHNKTHTTSHLSFHCDIVIEQVLTKCDLCDETVSDYCLWEMMGDGHQMTGIK